MQASTDHSVYVARAGAPARVTVSVRNTNAAPRYLQIVGGRPDVFFLKRVASPAGVLWSPHLLYGAQGVAAGAVTMQRLDSGAAVTGAFELPPGDYRALVPYGETPAKLDAEGAWIAQFSVR